MERKEQDELLCLGRNEDERKQSESFVAVKITEEVSKTNETMLVNEGQIQKVEMKNPVKIGKSALKLQKKLRIKRRNAMDNGIKKLAKFDLECKIALHKLQIEVEKKRIRNLDKEYDLIEAKIKYYKNKSLLNLIL